MSPGLLKPLLTTQGPQIKKNIFFFLSLEVDCGLITSKPYIFPTPKFKILEGKVWFRISKSLSLSTTVLFSTSLVYQDIIMTQQIFQEEVVRPGGRQERWKVWWLMLCISHTGLQVAQITCKTFFLAVSVRVLLEGINIWICRVSKEDALIHTCGYQPTHGRPEMNKQVEKSSLLEQEPPAFPGFRN